MRSASPLRFFVVDTGGRRGAGRRRRTCFVARENTVKISIRAQRRVLNAWCSIPSSYVAEVVAGLGFDSVTIDLQHGAIDYAAAFQMLQAISTSSAMPMVRVPWNDPAMLMKLLDAGAMGVICPMINTAEEARAFVGACRYPPMGFRSMGPNRAVQYSGADYWRYANAQVLLLAMIETRQGVENLEAILSVEGLDGVYVGPADLSMAYGAAPSMRPADAEVVAAIDQVRRATMARNMVAAIHTDGPATARDRFTQGFMMCTLQSDIRYIVTGASEALAAVKAP